MAENSTFGTVILIGLQCMCLQTMKITRRHSKSAHPEANFSFYPTGNPGSYMLV